MFPHSLIYVVACCGNFVALNLNLYQANSNYSFFVKISNTFLIKKGIAHYISGNTKIYQIGFHSLSQIFFFYLLVTSQQGLLS